MLLCPRGAFFIRKPTHPPRPRQRPKKFRRESRGRPFSKGPLWRGLEQSSNLRQRRNKPNPITNTPKNPTHKIGKSRHPTQKSTKQNPQTIPRKHTDLPILFWRESEAIRAKDRFRRKAKHPRPPRNRENLFIMLIICRLIQLCNMI
ncbi:hypothetical protein SAMN02910447_00739 [Ruminococcus sp. YE71]|nr:hypothetical protein SAMN02910446_00738 [Ruminococcus sp. YE78]SFW20054.1 hypothetical protein SAMN02910447_00739 [Ruminococcus sp. YE71]